MLCYMQQKITLCTNVLLFDWLPELPLGLVVVGRTSQSRLTRSSKSPHFNSMFSIDELDRAAQIVHRALAATPQIRWPQLCERVGADVWVKHENHTPVGAFKIRGALFYVSELRRKNPQINGVIAATRGNLGQSVAFAGIRAGLRPATRSVCNIDRDRFASILAG
jgi:threonine synthase